MGHIAGEKNAGAVGAEGVDCFFSISHKVRHARGGEGSDKV